MTHPISIFISYAHKDDTYRQELEVFLKPYIRNQTIAVWTDKDIVAGQKWNDLIKARLDDSEIILFLVSPDFLASDYINDIEIKNAVANNKVIIIPVIIRPIDMTLLQLNYLQVVPTGAKAIADWESRDKAWNDVLIALKKVFETINEKKPERISPDTSRTNNLKKGFSTDTLIKWFFVFLIAVCIGVFIYGVIQHDNYYYFTSFGGMGFGFLGYFLLRRRFSI